MKEGGPDKRRISRRAVLGGAAMLGVGALPKDVLGNESRAKSMQPDGAEYIEPPGKSEMPLKSRRDGPLSPKEPKQKRIDSTVAPGQPGSEYIEPPPAKQRENLEP
ncbi:hypothetical protein C4568_04610 [Candidatus Parcubacteria bacterium]|nr:MAG: hypothetical protein C4568_04610 [Candidatus Parcubacteria bacterium]